MAKDNTMLLLVGAGVVGLVLLSGGKKASARAPALPQPAPMGPGGRTPATAKPVVQVDADEGMPSSIPDISLPIQSLSSMEPAQEIMPPSRGEGLGVQVPIPAQPDFVDTLQTAPEGRGRWRVTNEDGSPVMANPTLAQGRAQAMADHVRTKRDKYDRPRLAVWQALAGIGVDGLYGPSTQRALQKMGARNVPRPVFKGAS